MKKQFQSIPARIAQKFSQTNKLLIYAVTLMILFGLIVPVPFLSDSSFFQKISPVNSASATAVYHDFSTGVLGFSVTPATVNAISQNDNWSGVPSFEGYAGNGLTNTEGVDPQTVLGTEFANNALPVAGSTNVNANKGNPDAYNTGGVTEFDTGTYLSLGIQGTGNADSPYIVMYLNTVGRTNITISYNLTDIDAGSNNAVMPVALQYRVGETGLFTNIPAAFVADATLGGQAGLVTPVSVILPPSCNNQPKVQVRIMTNNPVGQGEWVGVNNLLASAFTPTAANANITGRVFGPGGDPMSRTTVNLYDSIGTIKTTATNSFGFYTFPDLPVGNTYIVEARSKRFTISNPTQVVTLFDNVQDLNFYADSLENGVNVFSSFGKKKF